MMDYFLALNKPASIQSIYSIAKGQYRISNTGKTNIDCLSSTKTLLLSGKSKDFENFWKLKAIESNKQLDANKTQR